MGELDFIETRFKCYREMYSINKYIEEFKAENKDFKEVLDIVRNFSDEKKAIIFNNIEIKKVNKINVYSYLKQYQEFENFKYIDNEDLYVKFKKCEEYLEKENRYIKMHLIYIYTILDECILTLAEKLNIDIPEYGSSIITNIKNISRHPKVNTHINKNSLKEIFTFNRIRNDFIHNEGIISKQTIESSRKYYKMNDEEIKINFKLYDGEKIGLKIKDLRQYSKISNSILKQLHQAYVSNN